VSVERVAAALRPTQPLTSLEWQHGLYSVPSPLCALLLFHSLVHAASVTVTGAVVFVCAGLSGSVLWFLGTLVLVSMVGVAAGLAVGSISRSFHESQQILSVTLLPTVVFSGCECHSCHLIHPVVHACCLIPWLRTVTELALLCGWTQFSSRRQASPLRCDGCTICRSSPTRSASSRSINTASRKRHPQQASTSGIARQHCTPLTPPQGCTCE
jgi:hypothetical protein